MSSGHTYICPQQKWCRGVLTTILPSYQTHFYWLDHTKTWSRGVIFFCFVLFFVFFFIIIFYDNFISFLIFIFIFFSLHYLRVSQILNKRPDLPNLGYMEGRDNCKSLRLQQLAQGRWGRWCWSNTFIPRAWNRTQIHRCKRK